MCRIVVCSEENITCEVICALISDLGVEVHCVASVDELCTWCTRQLPDLILLLSAKPLLRCDDRMTGLRPKGTRRPALWLVTAPLTEPLTEPASEQLWVETLRSGVDQLMTLPIHPARLRRKIGLLFHPITAESR